MQITMVAIGRSLAEDLFVDWNVRGLGSFFPKKESRLKCDHFQTIVWNVFRMPTF